MDGSCFCSGYCSKDGMIRAKVGVDEDLQELCGLQKLTVGVFFRRLWVVGSEERSLWRPE